MKSRDSGIFIEPATVSLTKYNYGPSESFSDAYSVGRRSVNSDVSVIWMLYSSSCFWVHSTVEIEGLVPLECKSDMTLEDVGGSIVC